MTKAVIKANIRTIYSRIREQSPDHHFEFSDPFWVLITTILSHRTKDEVTDAAARGLYNKYRNAEGLATASEEDVLEIIRKVGFSSVKAPRIINAARLILNEFAGNVPANIDDLTSIKGVGRKTANVVLADAFKIPAIAVDTHVLRISNRLGISRSKDPEVVERELTRIVPKDIWLGFNPRLVEFGKKVCRPVGPRCQICNISEFCDYYARTRKKGRSQAMPKCKVKATSGSARVRQQ
ncbi:MAG: endonuclease III [Candidatus Thermoplasmatota archaeon]|jgi:endonuclease-3|nr:endonuclease III [Candidatus Thermoplasmatota archaeon]